MPTKKRKIGELEQPPHLCVVLDLDHTLLHARKAQDVAAEEEWSFAVHVGGDEYKVLLRPFAIEFWKLVAKSAACFGVWTAGIGSYADQIVSKLIEITGCSCDFVLDRRACTIDEKGQVVKDLATFKECLPGHDVVLVDDSSVHQQYNNNQGVLKVKPFFAGKDENDAALSNISMSMIAERSL